MKKFNIHIPDKAIQLLLIDKINNLTKPQGSLGRLEEIALQIGTIQQTLSPLLTNPYHVVFAADHGIAAQGVSLFPAEVTPQMVLNFLKGGAAINFLARQHGFKLKVADAGVNYDFEPHADLLSYKVCKGTRNFFYEAALTAYEFNRCIDSGAKIVKDIYAQSSNIISFGEMGIANTSTSSVWMHLLTGIELEKCVGAGTGFDSEGVKRKYAILQQAVDNYKGDRSLEAVLTYFGGCEMLMAVGAMLQAAELGMVILIDGFIMTAAVLAASKFDKNVLEYCIFAHQSNESGHRLMLDYLQARPLLNLGMRLGEGSGTLTAYPIVDSAVRMINEMSSFTDANVSESKK
ncbi:MAG: nicotinate-nucleotide--dimethylbenzimidazole phosphoribosyltransferase [Porphyromonadaceae bacterium CG2_30_38_12]|nr:MAG: nicotinate-nucleotide--dimethylbenzimidazole phosphoribosyltransferase [Porphyromonadaceae bacterium CG2_30_38_12]